MSLYSIVIFVHPCLVSCQPPSLYLGLRISVVVLLLVHIHHKLIICLLSRFRLVARSLHAFIMAQLPNAGSKLRSFPDAPGAVKAKKSEFPNPEAQTALQEVSNLKKNKHYSQIRDDITWVCDFISNPKKCILDGSELLAYFCKQYYFKVSYIAATARIEGASTTA